jgi:hypothetical protein
MKLDELPGSKENPAWSLTGIFAGMLTVSWDRLTNNVQREEAFLNRFGRLARNSFERNITAAWRYRTLVGERDRARQIGMRSRKRNLLLIISLLTPACCFAQGARIGTTQERKACSRDASHFCKKLLGDDMAVLRCLQHNRTALSPSCQKVFQSHGK